jgi:hypothetical protein
MAMITGCTTSDRRGGFMGVLGSVQQLAMGLATTVAGLFLGATALPEQPTMGVPGMESIDQLQPLHGFANVGWMSCVMTLTSIYFARRLRSAEGVSFTKETSTTHLTPPALELVPEEVPVAETLMES